MLLPRVIAREFKSAARSTRMHGLRIVLGAPLLIWFAFTAFANRISGAEALGQQVYFSIVYPLAYGVVVIAPALAASSIARERREGTLGLLFMTHLRPRHIIAAKYTALVLELVAFLCLALPFYTLPLILGGVAHDQILCDSMQLLGAVFFCAAVGVCASAACRTAIVAFFVALVFLLGLDLVFQFLLEPSMGALAPSQWIWAIRGFFWTYEPCMGLYGACDFFLGSNPGQIPAGLVDLGLGIGLGMVFLGLAAVVLPRVREESSPRRRVRWSRRLRSWNRAGNWLAALLGVLLIVEPGIMVRPSAQPWIPLWDWAPYAAFAVQLVFTVLVARAIAGEKEAGTLETLVSLPLTNRALIHRAIAASVRSCWGWWLFTRALLFLHPFFQSSMAGSRLVLLGALDSVASLAVIFGVGSFCSVTARDAAQATVRVLLLVGTLRLMAEWYLNLSRPWMLSWQGPPVINLIWIAISAWFYRISVLDVREKAART